MTKTGQWRRSLGIAAGKLEKSYHAEPSDRGRHSRDNVPKVPNAVGLRPLFDACDGGLDGVNIRPHVAPIRTATGAGGFPWTTRALFLAQPWIFANRAR